MRSHEAYLGKKIEAVDFTEARLVLRFVGGDGVQFWDAGQACCESRYMTTDDDLQYHIGAKFQGVEVQDAPSRPCEYDKHDCQFLLVTTSNGVFTIETHNEHNGYYGGFDLECVDFPGGVAQ